VHRIPLVLVLVLLGAAVPSRAQEPQTRAELLRQLREAKQTELEPYRPNAVERGMHLAEEEILPLLQRDGVYAKLGSLTTGSGFAFGAGFRDRTLVDGLGSLDLWAAGSLDHYWALEARGTYPLTEGGEVYAEGYARRYSYPSEEFFGIGPDSRRADQSRYRIHGNLVGGRLVAQVVPALRVGAAVERLSPEVEPGRSHDDASIVDRFPDGLPGLGEDLAFLHTTAFLEVDYREPKNARKGGWYRVDVSRYRDRTTGAFDFNRVNVDLRQYVSFLAERRVLAGRVLVSTTGTDGQVPFFMLPALGGRDTLRGFRHYRFRGPHAILLQGEYRWEIWSAFEGALFVDAGKVALRRSDLDLRDLETDYGIGFRFNTDEGVIMRIDAAFGSRDGKHLHVVFGGIF